MADALNDRWLPPDFLAEEYTQGGSRLEIDVATFQHPPAPAPGQYRPVLRQERAEIDIWPATFALGDALPVLPLRLTGDLFVPVDFESCYQEACRHRRLA